MIPMSERASEWMMNDVSHMWLWRMWVVREEVSINTVDLESQTALKHTTRTHMHVPACLFSISISTSPSLPMPCRAMHAFIQQSMKELDLIWSPKHPLPLHLPSSHLILSKDYTMPLPPLPSLLEKYQREREKRKEKRQTLMHKKVLHDWYTSWFALKKQATCSMHVVINIVGRG